jgi:site-specific recombinase XerD
MTPAEPFHGFLRWLLLEEATALELETWEAYGRRIWDYANYLHVNGLGWNESYASKGESALATYRDWQKKDLGLETNTKHGRVRLVIRFYIWAKERGLISELPFSSAAATAHDVPHDLRHVTEGEQSHDKPKLILDEWDNEPVFLTAKQANLARAAIRSTAHRLLFDLMACVGLRAEEARTFPLSAVFNPAINPDLQPGTLIRVHLNVREMDIKLNKPRSVDVPYSLMEEMYAYAQFERNRRIVPGRQQRSLLLTVHGNSYSKESALKVMADLGRKVGFRIVPLMLRHSYAVHTLLLLRALPEETKIKLRLEPLLYVRDQLGHDSVTMTEKYLVQIDRISGREALAIVGEFDNLYEATEYLVATYPRPPVETVTGLKRG